MKRALTIVGIAALTVLAQACASEAAKDTKASDLAKPQATIPFINMRASIQDWQADGQKGIWFQDAHKQWYYGEMFAPCIGLNFAMTIGIKNTTLNQLDRYSHIVVPNEHMGDCLLKSLVKSDPPPESGKHKQINKTPEEKRVK